MPFGKNGKKNFSKPVQTQHIEKNVEKSLVQKHITYRCPKTIEQHVQIGRNSQQPEDRNKSLRSIKKREQDFCDIQHKKNPDIDKNKFYQCIALFKSLFYIF